MNVNEPFSFPFSFLGCFEDDQRNVSKQRYLPPLFEAVDRTLLPASLSAVCVAAGSLPSFAGMRRRNRRSVDAFKTWLSFFAAIFGDQKKGRKRKWEKNGSFTIFGKSGLQLRSSICLPFFEYFDFQHFFLFCFKF